MKMYHLLYSPLVRGERISNILNFRYLTVDISRNVVIEKERLIRITLGKFYTEFSKLLPIVKIILYSSLWS